MNIDNILVIGPGSLIGSRFIELLDPNIAVWAAGGKIDSDIKVKNFDILDITDRENVETIFAKFPGKYVVNFAGATLVDEIEKTRPSNPENQDELDSNLAFRVNVLGTKNIISSAKKLNKFPIFISTGMVFNGKNGPYTEEDEVAKSPNEVSWYAWTKILSEKAILSSGIDNLIIRPSYPYRKEYSQKGDFARNFLKLYDKYKNSGKEIYPIFTDQILSPTFIDDFAFAIPTLIEKKAKGIFHLVSSSSTTPYDFCIELLKIARGVENPEQFVPKGSIIEFQKQNPDIAKRPIKGGEKSDKITKLGFKPTNWKEGIKICFGKN